MKKSFWKKIVLAGLAVNLALAATAQPVRVNLGTLAPRGSVYHQSLATLAEAWRTNGVKLVIYPDGTQGGEADMVRLMRIGSLQAGMLTAVGLSEIEPGINGLQDLPKLYNNFDELEYVTDKLRPMLEKRFADKGFVVLFWVDAGWVRYFSKEPILTPTDLKRMKIFTWSGDTETARIMKINGYNSVMLETSDILPGLETGLINATAVPPIFALAGQLDLRAPHMLNLNWGPLVGACVIKKSTWEKIPAANRAALLAAAEKAGAEIRANSRKESDAAVAAMQKRGLIVHEVTPEQDAVWRTEAEKLYPEIRGHIVPADIFDEVQRLVKEYRANTVKK